MLCTSVTISSKTFRKQCSVGELTRTSKGSVGGNSMWWTSSEHRTTNQLQGWIVDQHESDSTLWSSHWRHTNSVNERCIKHHIWRRSVPGSYSVMVYENRPSLPLISGILMLLISSSTNFWVSNFTENTKHNVSVARGFRQIRQIELSKTPPRLQLSRVLMKWKKSIHRWVDLFTRFSSLTHLLPLLWVLPGLVLSAP